MLWVVRVPLKLMPLDEVSALTPPKGGRLFETPRPKRGQGGDVAAVGGELLHLLAADEGADFAGFGLHLQSVGSHGDRLRRAADGQGNVGFDGLRDVHHDAGLA